MINLVLRSAVYHRKAFIYQVLITCLLAAVITGSLLTGWSVRESLKSTAAGRLGNTGYLITSGTRYFNAALAGRLKEGALPDFTGLLELTGFCQNLSTQQGSPATKIYAVGNDFFSFQGLDSIKIGRDEAIVNEKAAKEMGLNPGDELIVRFNEPEEIPSDAPFAPSRGEARSLVLRVGKILPPDSGGRFSLSISQITQSSVFISLSGLYSDDSAKYLINRILVSRSAGITENDLHELLKRSLLPGDIGLKAVTIPGTGAYELRSDRIFIDSALVREINAAIPTAAPVITYLGNSFTSHGRSTPYSFIAALPRTLYPDIPAGKNMIINRWMADDLGIRDGDSLVMTWYSPDSLNRLVENSGVFTITRIVEMDGVWADSLLMPDFPGISGSETCSEWDAGVPIKMKQIRPADEDYWKRYRGTPKAFISYEEGLKIWGSNYGPATAIRFPAGISGTSLLSGLREHIDPMAAGLAVSNLYDNSMKAADESVDFSSLFLSLGFFMILAAFVLLSFAVTSYLDARQKDMRTYFALGFRRRSIMRIMSGEISIILVAGSLTGAIAGLLINNLTIRLLNTVWQGAVRTNTLSAFSAAGPVIYGFLGTFFLTSIFAWLKIRNHLRRMDRKKSNTGKVYSRRISLSLTISALAISAGLLILSLMPGDKGFGTGFAAGAVLLGSLLLLWRHFLLVGGNKSGILYSGIAGISQRYYSQHPSFGVTPALFIASGIFAMFITGANRMDPGGDVQKHGSGTGGFSLWGESSIPLMQEMSLLSGRKELGLDGDEFRNVSFVQIKKKDGDDASCLNLNHVATPPLLGVDPKEFINRGSFSFAGRISVDGIGNPWEYIAQPPRGNTIYGIADQTVLEWGLKIRIGDTLVMRSENGGKLNIIIAAGLKSSIFQGYVITGVENFRKYFPSVPGYSIFLADSPQGAAGGVQEALQDRLSSFGMQIGSTGERLASFYEVTNTYLSVFGILGALGMITGVAGLGFVLLRNYNYRKREFALLLATGYRLRKIRLIILSEQLSILSAGIIAGIIPALIATLTSLKNQQGMPWAYLLVMVAGMLAAGTAALAGALRAVRSGPLVGSLNRE